MDCKITQRFERMNVKTLIKTIKTPKNTVIVMNAYISPRSVGLGTGVVFCLDFWVDCWFIWDRLSDIDWRRV